MKKKITLLLAMLLMLGTGSVWADADLTISNVTEWKAFCSNVNNGTEYYSGKTVVLTADIVMEASGFQAQTVGNSEANSFQGTFDGQGHTITYDFSEITKLNQVAPFRYIKNATIKNLKTAGTLGSDGTNMGGVVSTASGTCVIESCECGMAIISNLASGESNSGGIVGITIAGANLTVNNCIFSGSITVNKPGAEKTKRYCGIVGYLRTPSTSHIISNCLNIGTISGEGLDTGTNSSNVIYRAGGTTTPSNNYYLNYWGTNDNATLVTNEQLNSGEVAYNLQGSQATQYWGQDLNNASSTPMLTSDAAYKVFNAGDKYTNWTNTINNNADWVTFSKLVANGYADMNVTMTADVDASSTMVGTSSNPYQGTFDGAGHILTFTYSDANGEYIAPFQYAQNATFNNLLTAGSISAKNMLGGIIANACGTCTLNNCGSTMTLAASNGNSDSRVGGLVARCADNSTPAGTGITLNYCAYNGSISSSNKQTCGFIGWLRTVTATLNYCLAAPTSDVTGGGQNVASTGNGGTVNATNTYYTTKFGSSTQATAATAVQLASGSLAYDLNTDNTGTLFFGQGNLNKSIASTVPELTNVDSKKVIKITCTNGPLYANKGGAMPSPVGVKALSLRKWDGSTWLNGPFDEDVSLQRVYDKYILNVSSAGATTLVLPGNVSSLPANVKAYELTYTSGEKVTASEITSIAANKPVLINAPEGQYVLTTDNTGSEITYDTENAHQNGALYGVYTDTYKYVPANSYVLQNGDKGLGFYKVAEEKPIKITSFRAYLTAGTEARSLSIDFEDDNTTAIKQMRTSMQEFDAYFNLSGQRVAQPTKGLYIVNGKKVIIK